MFITNMSTKSEIIFVDSPTHESNIIVLDYVPVGFTLASNNLQADAAQMDFMSDDSFFSITMLNADRNLFINTEDATTIRTKVNDYDAYCSISDSSIILTWSDNQHAYLVCGTISEAEIRRIAENIR